MHYGLELVLSPRANPVRLPASNRCATPADVFLLLLLLLLLLRLLLLLCHSFSWSILEACLILSLAAIYIAARPASRPASRLAEACLIRSSVMIYIASCVVPCNTYFGVPQRLRPMVQKLTRQGRILGRDWAEVSNGTCKRCKGKRPALQ